MKKGIVYCIKSLNSNLIYICCTKQSLSTRRAKHIYDSKKENRMKPVHKLILENGGFNNFHFKTIKEVDDLSLLLLQEKKIIEDYKHNKDYILMNSYK